MNRTRNKWIHSTPGLLAGLILLLPLRLTAQPEGEEVHQEVARISYISGDASFSRGDDPDNWQNASLNAPMTLGDRVYSGDNAQMELQVSGGDFIRLAARTDLTASNLTDDVKQFSLQLGAANFHIRRLAENETFEVDTPNVAVTFDAPGDYRLDVDQDGNSRVLVRRGQAIVAAGGGQVPVDAGSEMRIDGIDSPQYDVVAISRPDSFDHWVDSRQRQFAGIRSYHYVSAAVVGAQDLDEYGRWDDVAGYGHCWTPANVEAGWEPYRSGHWAWVDPWGWTWVADEPWGWAPYHYGRWVVSSSRWYWVPVAPGVAVVAYSPALVAFVGGGPGWSASVSMGGGGYVGWFPLAPQDPFLPWWGPRAVVGVNVTNVTYVNRTYVTVVNNNTFVSGGAVRTSIVRDPVVVKQIVSAPVVRGALPVMPTAASLRLTSKVNLPAAPRPPSAVSRPVVTRVAPPPAPPTFQSKVALIRQNQGAPVAAAAAAKLSMESRNGARAIVPVRPAAAAGKMNFSPRSASAPKPQPVTAPKGKALATTERPVVASPAAAARPNAPPPAKIAPGAVATRPAPGAREGASPPAATGKVPPPSEDWRSRQPREGAQPKTVRPPETQKSQQPLAPRGQLGRPATAVTPPPARTPANETAKPAPVPPPAARKPQTPPAQDWRNRPEVAPRQRAVPPPPAREAAPAPRPEPQRLEPRGPAPAPQAKPQEKKQPPPKKPEKKETDKSKEKDKEGNR